MRAVLVDVPAEMLEDRRRRGLDRWDEMWEGVLHMVPPPTGEHQRLGSKLLAVLLPLAEARGLLLSYETGVFRSTAAQSDYRVPDLVVYRPEHASTRGVDSRVELVIELRSPDDETYDKLGFYELVGAAEVWVVEPTTREVELFVRRGDRLFAAQAPDGRLRSDVLGLTLRTVQQPDTEQASAANAIVVEWPGGTAAI